MIMLPPVRGAAGAGGNFVTPGTNTKYKQVCNEPSCVVGVIGNCIAEASPFFNKEAFS